MNEAAPVEVRQLIQTLLQKIQAVLGDQLVGLYLDGSLANGGFDEASDVDFVAVTKAEVSPELFLALQSMHNRFAAIDSPWAVEFEGFYISQSAVRRYAPPHPLLPNLERGVGERLKLVPHDENFAVHR